MNILKTCFGIALLLMTLAGSPVQADAIAYNGVVDLSAETDAVRAEHHHDYSLATNAARSKMISTTKDPFTDENKYAYLQLRDKATGAVLFRRPGPALSHIWVSPDSKYVVGISGIRIWNPYQLVVYNRSGDRLLERDIVTMKLRGTRMSASNFAYWYKRPVPQIRIVENGPTATLYIEDQEGGFHEFQFSAAK